MPHIVTEEELEDEYNLYVSYRREKGQRFESFEKYKKNRLKDFKAFGTTYEDKKFRHELNTVETGKF